MPSFKVLVLCEYSGEVRRAFRAKGADAWSCDLLPSDDDSRYHLQMDARELIHEYWDLIIAHPPCTYLTCSAEWAYGDGPYHQKVKPETLVGEARRKAREEAITFVLDLWQANTPRLAIENPVGVLSKYMGKPQIVQPYYFGEDASKKTCFWTRGLPPIRIPDPSLWYPPRYVNGKPRWGNQTDTGQNKLSPSQDRAHERSRTYPGIARALAESWYEHP